MEKVKNISLRKSLICHIIVFVLAAVLLSIVTSYICRSSIEHIQDSYPYDGRKYYLTDENGNRLGKGTYISENAAVMSERDTKLIKLLDALPQAAVPVYSAACIIAAVACFYRSRLKKPLYLLDNAAQKIAQNDLDFTVSYERNDEMGRLCGSFETMRKTLQENNLKLWRQIEERKRINAVFAHELRTPLTVLRGYGEMLAEADADSTEAVAAAMLSNISRLEKYANSMSSLSRIEEIAVKPSEYEAYRLGDILEETMSLLCGDKAGTFDFSADCEKIYMDESAVMQVYNNILSNAASYADKRIDVRADVKGELLSICVSDDGGGFSAECLKNAKLPYYTESEERSEHFGLGLYVSSVLCEKHKGYLEISNGSRGAAVKAVFKIAKID